MNDSDAQHNKLAELKSEHRDLDDVIARLMEDDAFNQVHVQRMKKRKLNLKDQIISLENDLLPNIVCRP